MNQLLLSRRLGLVGPQAFQRAQYERLHDAVTPDESLEFRSRRFQDDASPHIASIHSSPHRHSWGSRDSPTNQAVPHNGGVNVLAVDEQTGRLLITGGADSAIQVWDLEDRESIHSNLLHPTASITRSAPGSHTHALTSLSIYPFDPVPSTLITTSYDKTLKLLSIDAARIAPVHTFDVLETPYSHSLSPVASTTASLIAVGTAHPAIKLLDLRTGLTTHTLPGHNGAVFSVCWSPRSEHILASGSTDGRVLFFDIRRAHSAFACLDLDDALGVLAPEESSDYQPRPSLDWNAKAHNGPVTGVRWADSGRKLVTCGHDQRIRVWEAATGRNELVHFGPRIRNTRNGEVNPLSSPPGCGRPGKGTLFWANDDGKGEIFVMDLNEGTMQKVLRAPGAARSMQQNSGSTGRLTSGGRINTMAWRVRANGGSGLELYSGHGDGSIHCWRGLPEEDEELEDRVNLETETEQRRKRKRDLLEGLVDGLVKRPVGFS